MNEEIVKLANRLLDLDPYAAADNGETLETVAGLLINNPLYVVEKLLNQIEELTMDI